MRSSADCILSDSILSRSRFRWLRSKSTVNLLYRILVAGPAPPPALTHQPADRKKNEPESISMQEREIRQENGSIKKRKFFSRSMAIVFISL